MNDFNSDPTDVRVAAAGLLQQVKSVPNVIVIGPANAPAKKNLPAIDHALAEAAAANGRKYISTIGWDLEYQSDNLHPTAAGQKTYAKNLAALIP